MPQVLDLTAQMSLYNFSQWPHWATEPPTVCLLYSFIYYTPKVFFACAATQTLLLVCSGYNTTLKDCIQLCLVITLIIDIIFVFCLYIFCVYVWFCNLSVQQINILLLLDCPTQFHSFTQWPGCQHADKLHAGTNPMITIWERKRSALTVKWTVKTPPINWHRKEMCHLDQAQNVINVEKCNKIQTLFHASLSVVTRKWHNLWDIFSMNYINIWFTFFFRYVSLQIVDKEGQRSRLTLCEVQVF